MKQVTLEEPKEYITVEDVNIYKIYLANVRSEARHFALNNFGIIQTTDYNTNVFELCAFAQYTIRNTWPKYKSDTFKHKVENIKEYISTLISEYNLEVYAFDNWYEVSDFILTFKNK